jgi:co-chaperonin GroES (HSP10)
MKIEPFGERVAVKVLPIEEKTQSGLIMTSSKNNSNRGEIVAVGTDVKDYLKVGNVILFTQNAGVNYTDGTEDYKILSTKDVLCKVIEG